MTGDEGTELNPDLSATEEIIAESQIINLKTGQTNISVSNKSHLDQVSIALSKRKLGAFKNKAY